VINKLISIKFCHASACLCMQSAILLCQVSLSVTFWYCFLSICLSHFVNIFCLSLVLYSVCLSVCHVLVFFYVCLSFTFWYCILSVSLSRSSILFFWYCILVLVLSVCYSVCHILVFYSVCLSV